MGLTSVWHIAITPYEETSIFKVSYLFCHNANSCFFSGKISEVQVRSKHPLKFSPYK